MGRGGCQREIEWLRSRNLIITGPASPVELSYNEGQQELSTWYRC